MKKRDIVYLFGLLAILALAAVSGVVIYVFRPTPTPTPTVTPMRGPTPTPFSLQAPGWEEVTVHTLCLEVEQSYPQIKGEFSEPIAEAAQRILARVGLQVVGEGASCDATLTVTLSGQAQAAYYLRVGNCYTGAEVNGQVTLTAPDREPLTATVKGWAPTPDFIYVVCPREPIEAPFWIAWQEALLDGLAHLWGPRLLIQALGDEEVWNAAAEVLGEMVLMGEMEPEEVVPLLVQALGNEESMVRRNAAWALGKIGPWAKEAVPVLIQALGDEDEGVRSSAAEALGEIGPKEGVIPALMQALGDEDELVRWVAARALGEIGSEAKAAVPLLIQALGDEDEDVRRFAAEALREITGQDFGQNAAAWQEWWEEQE